jgi:NADPH:quinone reductase-like Zn-dependent oxidoreductase
VQSSIAPSSVSLSADGPVGVNSGTMKAVIHTSYGSVDGVELRDVEKPVIEDHQVLVRVHASSVNPAEWYGVMGPIFARVASGLRKPKSGAIGSDLAGTIEAVGKDVTEFQPGDEVFGTSGHSWAEYAPAREPRLVKKPANVSFEEAASVPIAALTALQALRDKGRAQPGQKVLINGASGGVGTFAVQIAKALGAEVTAVCSTRNVETARSLGADVVCDYTQEDFTESGVRHDLMLDIAGSRPFRQFRRVLTPKATVVLVGGRMKRRGLGPLLHLGATLVSSLVRSQKATFFIAKINKDDLEFMRELLETAKVKPVVDRTYELSQVRDALRYLGEGHARGKIVITM